MGWFKHDDNMRNNKKFIRMSHRTKVRVSERDAARLYYSDLIAYCSHNLTDGFVPADVYEDLDPTGGKLAELLASNELLFSAVSDEYGEGWLIPDYLDWQRPRAQIVAERAGGRERVAKHRAARKKGDPPDGGAAGASSAASRNGTRNAVTSPVTPPVTPGARNAVTSTVSNGTCNGGPETETELPNSSSDEESPKYRASAEMSSSSTDEASKWKFDGPQSEWKPDPYNPRCIDHAKIPVGMRGPTCGVCARVTTWARKELARTGKGQSAAQQSRNGDDRRRRMAEIARARFGDEALSEGFTGLRAIEGGR